jgi:hypothetical protein
MSSFITYTAQPIVFELYQEMRWAGHVERALEGRRAYMVLVGKHEGKRLLGIRTSRWEDSIKMDCQETGWGMDWINVVRNRVCLWFL